MPSFSVRVAYRPLRVAWLLRDGDMSDLVRAVTLSTGIWGGLYAPMVPVGGRIDAEATDRWIRRFCADIVVPVVESSELSEVVERNRHLRAPYFAREPVIDDNEGLRYSLVDMKSLLAEQAAVFDGRRREGLPAVEAVWREDHPLGGALSALFGRFPTSETERIPDLRNDFADRLSATQVDISADVPSGTWTDSVFPVHATGFALRHYGRPIEGGVVVGNPRDPLDLTAFWNLRASGANVVFCDPDLELLPREAVTAHMRRTASRATMGTGEVHLFTDITICAPRTDDGRPPELPTSLREVIPEDVAVSIDLADYLCESPIIGNLPPSTEPQMALGAMEERFGAEGFISPLPEKPFNVFPGSRSQMHVVSVQPSTWSSHERGWTLSLPFVRDLNEWYSSQMRPAEPSSLRIQPEGFDLIVSTWNETLEFYPIAERALVSKLFDRAGLTMAISTPGQIADRIVDVMSHGQELRLLRIPGVRSLLAKQESRSGIKYRHAAEVIRDFDGKTGKASFDRIRETWGWQRVTPEDVLIALLERDVFRPGISIICPQCRLKVTVGADEIATVVKCPLCGHEFAIGPRLRELHWVLTLSGVFRREGGSEGAIPSVLCVDELQQAGWMSGRNIRLPAVELSGSGVNCETDFVLLQVSREGGPSVCVGECKENGEIVDDDLDKLKAVRSAIRASGVECLLAFAVMRSDFTQDELRRFKAAASQFRDEDELEYSPFSRRPAAPPIMLTAQELEGSVGLRRPADGVPHLYPSSLRDLAENSYARYLEPS